MEISNEKIMKVVMKVLEQNSLLIEKIERLERNIEKITGISEQIIKAKDIIELKKIILKDELLESLGLSKNNNRAWRSIRDELIKDNELMIHPGVGRVQTLLIHRNNSSNLSKASDFFLRMKKNVSYNPLIISQSLNISLEEATKIFDEIYKIFEDRIEKAQGDKMFRKKY